MEQTSLSLSKMQHFQKVLPRTSYQPSEKKYKLQLINLIAILPKITMLIIFNSKRNGNDLFNVSGDITNKLLSCLNMKMAAGMNQISAKLLKIAADVLNYPLPRIKNLVVRLYVLKLLS